jgi:hypothetical protein
MVMTLRRQWMVKPPSEGVEGEDDDWLADGVGLVCRHVVGKNPTTEMIGVIIPVVLVMWELEAGFSRA